MDYKVIFIDWDGTLSNSRFWEKWRDQPQHNEKWSLIQEKLFQGEKGRELINDWMTGYVSYGQVLNYVSDATGIPIIDLEKELQRSCEDMKIIDDRIISRIQRLRKKGMKVLIATDNMDTFRKWTIPSLGLESLFDGILTSDTQGVMKSQISPDGSSMFFGHYFNQNNVKPSETVLIDDSLNSKKVESFGMNFLHVSESEPLITHLDNILLNS
jgi:FMN phosphatase YigB (HAD superfamily)